MANGKLIVLDGLDGCGKSTQFDLLLQEVEASGKNVHGISFPAYGTRPAALVEMYLHGDFSTQPEGVNAYAASSFYAVDRYANYKLDWENQFHEGTWILASRYTTSNAIHQMAKLPQEEWDSFLAWLEDYEYDKLGLPRPDLVLYLQMPLETSLKLLQNRFKGGSKDIHEADPEYLANCYDAAEYAADRWGWEKVPCCEDGHLRHATDIRDMLLERIHKAFSV